MLAFLALDGNAEVPRMRAAEELWPDNSLQRALANVRSAVCHGRRVADTTVIERDGTRLALSDSVGVDFLEVQRRTRQVNDGGWAHACDSDHERLIASLGSELLPAWTDGWLVLKRQQWDQVRLHTLETLARDLRADERFLSAMRAALVAIGIAPMRETAHRVVIENHLAEGNPAEALAHFQRYRALLQRELGVSPSSRIARLVSGLFSC
ncbi:BTAD domain-containing putative transcriptional regulator [Saccharopolyspora sp. NFXS83]|uniref:AfsR/SARP family transcriptional regulator n=1 Tax=Saccharopolyspora sp. NFXS83 TaxID=2993560 RepID=UPI00224B1C45|nr:BTAD domain-containing putative transcriptional regulator [Saccharopolyspora sp. NFXS83]MCX2729200.1 BTAD domain-containing putative transcriptional regulator [Saccharopolyspora sp. NFXS83]